jgi:osmotically inducible protein OsmC
MPVRIAEVTWTGPRDGHGEIRLGSGAAQPLRYTFATRFEEDPGSNPEELLAGSLAACFTMALAGRLTRNDAPPKSLAATAEATIEKVEGDWTVTGIALRLRGDVPGLAADKFAEHAQAAKDGCPISRALRAVPITLTIEG